MNIAMFKNKNKKDLPNKYEAPRKSEMFTEHIIKRYLLRNNALPILIVPI